MKTALLTGLTAFAVGATGTLALSGTGSAAPASRPSLPVATTSSSAEACADPASRVPSCVVERVLTADVPAAAPPPGRTATDDDGTPDQGRGDVAPAPAPAGPVGGVELRGDGSVDDTQPGVVRSTASASADDDGTADQGRGDRPRTARDDDPDDDRSGRRGGDGHDHDDDRDDDHDDRDDDRSGRGSDDRDDDRDDADDDRDDDRDDDGRGGDDDGTADQGSGDR